METKKKHSELTERDILNIVGIEEDSDAMEKYIWEHATESEIDNYTYRLNELYGKMDFNLEDFEDKNKTIIISDFPFPIECYKFVIKE